MNTEVIENPGVDLDKMVQLQADNMETHIIIKTVDLKDTVEENLKYLKDLQQNGETVLLLTYWHIGRVLHGMNTDSKYGDNIIIKAGETLNLGKTTLHAAVKFYCDYKDPEEVNTLSSNGNVNWSHIKQVQRIAEPSKRAKLIEILKKKPVTITETSDMVKKLNVGHIQNAKKDKNKKAKRYSPTTYFNSLQNKMIRHKNTVDKITTDLATLLADLEGVMQVVDRDNIPDEQWQQYMQAFHDAATAAKHLTGSVTKLHDKQLAVLMDKYTDYYESNTAAD